VSGQIRIDGTDIRKYTLKSSAIRSASFLQDTLLFRASIWDNIAYGSPDASPEETSPGGDTRERARLSSLSLPEGYATMVGERGVDAVSGGPTPGIAIARAIVRNAPILILDDRHGPGCRLEQAVIDALDRLMKAAPPW